jgi:hypothetical protein
VGCAVEREIASGSMQRGGRRTGEGVKGSPGLGFSGSGSEGVVEGAFLSGEDADAGLSASGLAALAGLESVAFRCGSGVASFVFFVKSPCLPQRLVAALSTGAAGSVDR